MFSRSRPLLCVIATGISFGPSSRRLHECLVHRVAEHDRFIGRKLVQQCFMAPDERGCLAGSSLREIAVGLRCSMSSRCGRAISPDRPWYAMPHSLSIQAPISRVVRGSLSVIHAVSRSCWFAEAARAAVVAKAHQSIDAILLVKLYQLRIVSSSRYSTFATVSQLIPWSSSSSALARRARRCATEPSRVSSIRSCRDSPCQEAGTDHSVSRIPISRFGKRFVRVPAEFGYNIH